MKNLDLRKIPKKPDYQVTLQYSSTERDAMLAIRNKLTRPGCLPVTQREMETVLHLIHNVLSPFDTYGS